MKRPLIQIYFLFLAIIITIILADCALVSHLSFHGQIAENKECANLPNHLEDSHLNHYDDVSCFNSEIQPNRLIIAVELFPSLSVTLKCNYINCIWQPPKRS